MAGDPNCTLCKLCKTTDRVCVIPEIVSRKVMMVGEAPGANEEKTGKLFSGQAGQLLEEIMEEQGFSRERVFITNAVSCRPPDNRTPSKAEIRTCKKWLDYQIAMVKPKFVLLMGNVPLMSVTGETGIKKKRGKPFEKDGITYLPTYHPAYILRDPNQRPLLEKDMALFATIVKGGGVPREEGLNLKIVLTWKDVKEMIDALEGSVSFDLETDSDDKDLGGLYPWAKGGKITSIGFGTRIGEFIIPVNQPESLWSRKDQEKILEMIEERLEGCFLIAQAGKFDFLWLWVYYGVRWYKYFDFDTMLASYILDENSPNGLKYLAQVHCGAPDWDVDADTKMGKNGMMKQALYHAHDVYYTRKLRFILGKKLAKDQEIKRVFDKLLMPCARMFTEIEYDGVTVDMEKFPEAEKYLRGEVKKREKALAKWQVDPDMNWGSTQQVGRLLYGKKRDGGLGITCPEKTKTGNPSTAESALKQIDHACVADLLALRGAKQQLSFFIEGWKPYLVRDKLHPSFKLHGTVTGRPSCEHPNLQQVPRDERIRSMITADDGWVLVDADLSQIELRIAAELANEPAMLEAFAAGKDVHWLTAIREIERGGGYKDLVLDTARTWKQNKKIDYSEAIEILIEMGPDEAATINPKWKEIRKKAKAINFGYLYGMWWKKFIIYARDNYDMIVTAKEAEASRNSFFSQYKYDDWHRRQKKYARNFGYVTSLSGRKRRLPDAMSHDDSPRRAEAERQAVNSPVQGFASDLNLMAALQLRKEFGRSKVRICGTVHDSILAQVKKEYVAEVVPRLLEIMSHPELMDVFEIDISVPIVAEAKVGPWSIGVPFEQWLKTEGERK